MTYIILGEAQAIDDERSALKEIDGGDKSRMMKGEGKSNGSHKTVKEVITDPIRLRSKYRIKLGLQERMRIQIPNKTGAPRRDGDPNTK